LKALAKKYPLAEGPENLFRAHTIVVKPPIVPVLAALAPDRRDNQIACCGRLPLLIAGWFDQRQCIEAARMVLVSWGFGRCKLTEGK